MLEKIKNKEQKKIDITTEKIKNIEKNVFKSFKEGKDNYYNINISCYEQKTFQETYYKSKSYLDEYINPILKSPFIGKIHYFSVLGNNHTAYIGKKGYSKGDVKIHDWRSVEGQALRNRRKYYEGMNIMLNRTLNVRNFKLYSYVDHIFKSVEYDVSESIEYKNILEFNKKHKDILTTLDQIQNEIIDLPLDKNVVLQGVPGSGKTAIGGYRLSNIAYRLTQNLNKNFKLLYVTTSYTLKAYTIKHFNQIDLDYIDFITMEDIYNFSKLLPQSDDNKKSVLVGKFLIKGELTKPFKDFNGRKVEVILPDGYRQWYPKNEVKLYRNEWKTYTKIIFGESATNKKVRKFLDYQKSEKLFKIMNDLENEVIILEIGKKSTKKDENHKNEFDLLNDFLKKQGYSTLKESDTKYLIDFSKIYYLLKTSSVIPKADKVSAIFLDEAQDFTLIEIEFIRTKYPNANFTLCGDVNQSNGRTYVQDTWDDVITLLNAKFKTFNKCYRSSKNVVELFNSRMTNTQYGKAEAISDKEGRIAQINNFENFLARNKGILNENSCFIYLKSETSFKLENLLKNTEARLLHANNVKGLEFKNVFLLDNDDVRLQSENKKFRYMLASRSLENFYLVGNY